VSARPSRRVAPGLLLFLAATALAGGAAAAPAAADNTRPQAPALRGVSQPAPVTRTLDRDKVTIRSAIAVDLQRDFARLPLYRARIGNRTAWYVITDVSDRDLARRRGLNFSPRLANLITPDCPGCVQTVASPASSAGGSSRGPPAWTSRRGGCSCRDPTAAFPIRRGRIGAVGDPGYSPYVRIRGTRIVYNAPIVATGTNRFDTTHHADTHDRLLGIDTRARRPFADMNFIRAFALGKDITYLSFESSSATAGLFDRTTLVPGLVGSPAPDRGRDPQTARSAIFAFANGPRVPGRVGQGLDHVVAVGLNRKDLSLRNGDVLRALRRGGDAHNVLDSFPVSSQPELYSPLWDIQEAHWTDAAVMAGQRRIVTDANEIRQLAAAGLVTSPGGTQLRSNRAILNCPALSFLSDRPAGDVVPAPPGQP
jgi:hypothetical protein